ncbi:unnamed protein product [Kuraishia capsulata CBS 1993]|uniref:Pre-mRNA-splicing factor CWC21 n=1 Tax=Kuraishia capsulata CBS 1993 TaxID=1382522 RepID=W6ML52_9ASCO|nr:uncharacterized protein KUCA_T00003158001 [Kuraishia capsulata CBS 1993]CDK27181.1 unnamed protein product [Kuraishia capsulata CBS 1993]
MSYNGIGLKTARGTGTNGYVQRNLASAKRQEGQANGQFARRELISGTNNKNYVRTQKQLSLGKDVEISEHESKRAIEVRCMDLREELEDGGLDDETIDLRVDEFRERLMKRLKPVKIRHNAELKEEQSRVFKESIREREPYGLKKLRPRSRSPPQRNDAGNKDAEKFIKDFEYKSSMY